MRDVFDKNGVILIAGQSILVHQNESVRKAVVVEPFPDSPTKILAGHWVDINIENRGVEGMPSYILEVVKE